MVVAKSAGSFLGGIFNNPGIVILGALAVVLLFFQGDIRKAFASLGQGISEGISGIGDIDINLPEINFPDITFPSFDFGGLFGGGEPQIVAPLTQPGTGGFNPADMPVAPTPIDIALSEGATPEQIAAIIGIDPTDPNLDPTKFLPPTEEPLSPFAGSIQTVLQNFGLLTPAQQFAIEERGATEESLGLVPFAVVTRAEDKIVEPVFIPEGTTLTEFPTAIVPETQEQFQARSESFAEAFPNIAFSTSLTDEITFGEQLSRNSEDFQAALDAEARRSEAIFANLFGNVQNPDFPTFTDPVTGEII